MVSRSLVIGYGNPYRHDDGVGFHLVNRLRGHLGLQALDPEDDGLDGLGHPVDSVVLHQLLPELAPVLANYQVVVFVDAHAGGIPEEIRLIKVQAEYGFQAVTHHLSPEMLLALVQRSVGQAPPSWLISIHGEDFDFGEGLSPECEKRAKVAVHKVLELVKTSWENEKELQV